MARITVEDCIVRIPSRFELVMLSAQRARDVSAGAPLTVDRDNDKNPVVALREIAEETVTLDHLRYELIHGLRRHLSIPETGTEEQPIIPMEELPPEFNLQPAEPESGLGLPPGVSYSDQDVPEGEDRGEDA